MGRFRAFSALLLVLGGLLSALSAWAERIDFVFDLDEVLVDKVLMKPGLTEGAGLLKLPNGKLYRIRPGAGEMIQSLLSIPDAHVSFFSAASAERNAPILKAIKLPDGRSAFDIATIVLNRTDLTATDAATAQRLGVASFDPAAQSLSPEYSHDIKKDVTKVPGATLDRTVLIDDTKQNAARGQERNLLQIRNDLRAPGDSIEGVGLPENDLTRARGVIAQALEDSAKNHTALADEVTRLQAAGGSPENEAALFRKGLAEIQKTAPAYRAAVRMPGAAPLPCVRAIKELLRGATL